MADTAERVVAGRTTGRFELGDRVTWEARHLGRTRRMTVEISAYERPRMFRDEQVDGPFRRFVHEHFFEAVADGTLMRDVVAVDSIGGVIVAAYLRRLLVRRNGALRDAAERA